MLKVWYVYILRCNDHSLYTGITNDLSRRMREHNAQNKLAAKYLRGKLPVKLVFQLAVPDRGTALQVEYKIKQLDKNSKESLVNDPSMITTLLLCQ